MHKTIGFIGGGNMARSLIGGLLQDGYDPSKIRVCDPAPEQRQRLKQAFDIQISADSANMLPGCDCIVLAVKPQVLRSAVEPISNQLARLRPLVISIAAGIRVASIQRWLASDLAIVRCMPNTPALIQAGATGLYANATVTESQRNFAESVLRAVGLTLWLDNESQIDAVTAVSGSGPAYIFLVIEAMQSAAESLGLSPEQSRLLCLQTVFGAAKMALEDAEPVARLREQVTSKGGTTERGLEVLQQGGFVDLFRKAISAARDRAEALAVQLDQH
ncbi:MAG TPA: pyrroline-5-carboxylate reductase [Gammaproteobacteria bacterium]|jgi:pyrroline-5-carboxylate reductase